jgi:inorganic pyrophosphatase
MELWETLNHKGNPTREAMELKKIKIEGFEKLKKLFPDNEEMWIKYKKKRLEQFEKQEIDVFVIENNEDIIGEVTVNYKSHQLETETLPNKRVYFEAFRVEKKYQGQGLGQKLINYCINYLTNRGYTEFTIGVEDDNEIAKHIYSKLGFNCAIDKGHGDEFDPCEYTLYLKDINKTDMKSYIGKMITAKIDRQIGSKHPKHGFIYPINYGYIPNTISGDGEELDCYILGVFEPIESFTGKCIAIIHRLNDNDDKLVLVPKDKKYTNDEIRALTEFQERFFESIIIN